MKKLFYYPTFLLFLLSSSFSSKAQVFQREVLYPGKSNVTTVQKAMDIDLDGDLDYLSASSSKLYYYEHLDSLTSFQWRANDGTGNFSFPVSLPLPAGKRVSRFACADINKDGKTDLIFALANPGQQGVGIYVCYHTSGLNFDPPVFLLSGFLSDDFDYFQDVNGDNYTDYITPSSFQLNQTNGTFGPKQIFGHPEYAGDADLYDMDDDGMKDLVFCWATSPFNFPFSQFIGWKKQTAPGVFGTSNLICDTIKGVEYLKVFKDSATQAIQIAVSRIQSNNRAYVLRKTSSGFSLFAGLSEYAFAGFYRQKSNSNNDVLFNSYGERIRKCNCTSTAYPGLDYYNKDYKAQMTGTIPPVFGDFDGNGTQDQVIDGRAWYSFDGYSRFIFGANLDTQPMQTGRLEEGDVDDDGLKDLISVSEQHLTYFKRLPSNVFDSPRHIGFHPWIEPSKYSGNVEVSDFDSDGKTDILIYSSWGNSLLLFKGLGAGLFTNQPQILPISNSFGGNEYITQFQAKDINTDGMPDAVVRNRSKLYYARNVGGTSLAILQVLINDSISRVPVVFIDVDQDGKEDVVAHHRNRLFWYKRLTNTTFSARQVIYSNIAFSSNGDDGTLFAEDTDNDGDVDIVFQSRVASNILFFRNNGTANFSLVSSQVLQGFFNGVYLKDMAGDGYPDPVIVKRSATEAVFMMSHTPSGVKPLTSIINGKFVEATAFIRNSDSQKYDVVVDSGSNKLLIYRNRLNLARSLSGNIFLDKNHNCLNNNEPGLSNIMVRCKPGGYLSTTDNDGKYEFLVPFGDYEIEPIVLQGTGLFLDSICPAYSQAVTVDSSGSDSTSFGATLKNCSFLRVSVNTPRIRRCARNNAYLSLSNTGMATAYQTLVKIRLPYYVSMASPGNWVWNAADSTYQILVDSLPAMATQHFNWVDSVHCVDGIMGQWQCTKAWIVPGNNTCLPTIPSWDQSIIRMHGFCQSSGASGLILKNTGPGNMSSPRPYRLYAGASIIQTGNYQLNSGDSLILTQVQPGNKVEADQGDANPFGKWVATTLQYCTAQNVGTSNGYSHNYSAFGDETEDCGQIRDSFDPNEKTALPEGSGPESYVRSGATIFYTLHFQNMGNDTAFKVLVADSLSTDLDPTSLQITAASHPYKLKIRGNEQRPALHFIFDPIALTDTLTNKEKSTGFISFTIKLKPGLPQGRVITNTASIYFDQNKAVVTNTTLHTVRDNYPILTSISDYANKNQILVLPNPNDGQFSLNLGEEVTGTLTLTNLLGKSIEQWNVNPDFLKREIDLRKQITPGLYVLKFENQNGVVMTSRLVIQ